MGIMQGVLEASFDAAAKANEHCITAISLTIGEMTEIQPFALEFAFEALTKDTIAEGATLDIVMVKPKSRCNGCGHEYEHDRFQMLCPACGSFDLVLLQGRELQIDSIETEDQDTSD